MSNWDLIAFCCFPSAIIRLALATAAPSPRRPIKNPRHSVLVVGDGEGGGGVTHDQESMEVSVRL